MTNETNQSPTWCDMIQQERYQLLGELVDAMIYSPQAVIEVQQLVNDFKERGLVKSIINPKNESNGI